MKNNLPFVFGFAIFGFMIGNLAGLSSAELTITLLGLLFSIIGGSIIAFIKNIDQKLRNLAGSALLLFSMMFLIGLYSGIYVKVNDLLSPNPSQQNKTEYLKSGSGNEIDMLKRELMQGSMSLEEVCEYLSK